MSHQTYIFANRRWRARPPGIALVLLLLVLRFQISLCRADPISTSSHSENQTLPPVVASPQLQTDAERYEQRRYLEILMAGLLGMGAWHWYRRGR